ncbi:hypothetical protein [Kitasatospora sp. NPDC085464]|uniref:hypothetical protein n=1 Tax=Kitasatospora sp. NPDC085464 TaxID=3364063 RepID=UPI0037C8EECB
MRTRTLPVLTASAVLLLSACDHTTPAAPPADPAAAAAPALIAPTDAAAPLPSAPAEDPKVTLVTPVADHASAGPSAAPAAPVTPKSAPKSAPRSVSPQNGPAPSPASPSPAGTPVVAGTAGAPVVAGTAGADGAPGLKLDSYDKGTGKAVLAVADTGRNAPSPSATSAATAAVRVGQVIDSPPSAAAPQGALLAITEVKSVGAGKVAVSTRPATISELLGDTWADVKSALDPRKIQVTPRVKDLKASYVPKADGGQGSASAALQLNASDSITLPGGAKASLTGSIELDPSVEFSYQGSRGILRPEQARIGFDLGAHADWHLTASLTGSTGPVRMPIATLTAAPTVMVGPVPVVITLNVTVYAAISADGSVTVDTTQSIDGAWAVHSDYTRAGGWTSTTEPVSTKVTPVKATFSGRADVRAGLVAEGSVALYDTVGVKASVEPYLRASVDGSVTVDSSGAKPVVEGTAGLYGGLDVNGALMARIAVFGTPLLEKDLPFKIYHNEWPIAAGSYRSGNGID